MKKFLSLLLLLCNIYVFGQTPPQTSCGQKQVTENLFKNNPQLKILHEQIEARLYEYNRTKAARTNDLQSTDAVVYLPVVVHIIHNNGPENISNSQVQTAIQHLNEAFANSGYYDPADGVNTQIQFCLAKRDPNGNATNGIDRVASPLTVMNGWQDYSTDLALKNLSRWDPRCYINIWVVKEITGGVAGYAYLPSAHGSNVDGIVLEAGYFGTSYSNDIVVIHEMGHYLGLYHTFEGGCSNNDCARDGDRICDTPPDQSTGYISCNGSMNSCTTDALSGFSTDQNDLLTDYMDYGNWNCMKVYTQGQSDRMNWIVQNTRQSLLNCRSCSDPCPTPVTSNFTSSANNVTIGTLVNFTNTSSNAIGYRWYINNVQQSAATNFSYTFNTAGTFVVKLVALPGSNLCDSSIKRDTVRVTCPVTAGFTPLATNINVNVTVNFTNTSTGATSYNWFVNGNLQGTGTNFSYAFTGGGNYIVMLKASNGMCSDSIAGTVVVRDTCMRQTFQKTYGGSGDDVAYDVRSTTDGGYIMAGKTSSFGNGNNNSYDGYLVKMDAQGNVQWSRTYGGANEDVFSKIMQTNDGGYIIVGTSKSYGNPAGDAWVVKTDGLGEVQWARRFGENTANGEQGINICITSDGGYAVIGSHNAAPATSNVLVFKLDANGTLLWSKVFDSGNTDGGSYITQDNDVLMATAFTRTSVSYHDAVAMKLDINSGNLLWMYRYEVDGRNNFAGEIYKVGNTYKFHVPTIQDFTALNTGRHIILTLDIAGNATAIQQLVPPDYGTGPILIAPDGGIVAAYNEQNMVSDFNIMKLSTAGAVQWSKKYTRPGPQLNYILRASQDGSYISVGASNPATNNDIYVAKTDVQGNSAGCDTAAVPVAVVTPPYSYSQFTWSINRNANFIAPVNINVQSSAANTPSTALCTGTTCVETPPDPVDSCNVPTFVKHYSKGEPHKVFYNVIPAAGGQLLVSGLIADTAIASPERKGLLLKLDAEGNVVWQKKYTNAENNHFIQSIKTIDNNYVALSNVTIPGSTGFVLLKIDADGNTIWKKEFLYGGPYTYPPIKLIQSSDGSLFVLGTKRSGNDVTAYVSRISSTGSVVWSKNYAGLPQFVLLSMLDFVDDVNTVAVIGEYYITDNSQQRKGFITRINKADGSLAFSKNYQVPGETFFFEQVTKYGADLIILGRGSASSFNFRITPSGSVLKAQRRISAGIGKQNQYISPNGDIFITSYYYVSDAISNYVFALQKMDSSWSPVWAKRYMQLQSFNTSSIFQSAGKLYVGGYTAQNQFFSFGTVAGFNSAGELTGCPSDSFSVVRSTPTVVINDFSYTDVQNLQPNNSVINYTATDPRMEVTAVKCNEAVQCKSFKISGADTVCRLSDTLRYTVRRDSACNGKVQWYADPSYVKIISSTDTTVDVVFKKTGAVSLYGTIAASCNILQDSLRISVFTSPNSLNLGADRLLCSISTTILNAGRGFMTYKWQDGSSDSTYTVYTPGVYHVEARDYCGNVLRDTLVVSLAPAVPFDLGADISKCEKDTITLTAPAGFVKYNWTDNYNISSRYEQSVRIWPTRDTVYSVVAETAAGCLVYDTIRVTIKTTLPQNFLDTAAEFCPGEKATLRPKGSFSKYRWSNGSTLPEMEVSVAALYWLEVTNADGCTNREYINVKQKNCKNTIDFPNAFTPNNDRANETYKPIVKGILTKYKLAIYNRWGQRVFETTDPSRAWDGRIAGRLQDSNSFVWYCEYQFAGEQVKMAKGMLMLIR